jgi:TPR repeat protein
VQGRRKARSRPSFGFCYHEGIGTEIRYDLAARWYRESAIAGNPAAMRNLGLCFRHGEGVAEDDRCAVAWLRQSAAAGNPLADVDLAKSYECGWGVEKDEDRARLHYRRAFLALRGAARSGDKLRLGHLGDCYFYGRGTGKNRVRAIQCYEQGADAGDRWAQYRLGCCYVDGTGVQSSREVARHWLRKAAQGLSQAAQKLQSLD